MSQSIRLKTFRLVHSWGHEHFVSDPNIPAGRMETHEQYTDNVVNSWLTSQGIDRSKFISSNFVICHSKKIDGFIITIMIYYIQ